MVTYRLAPARKQVLLDSKSYHQWELPDGVIWTVFHRTDAGYLLRFPGLADFTVSAKGHNVVCYPIPGVPEDTTQHLYMNQVLPLALSMLGKLVFHGSAVEVGKIAIAFVAKSGRGKSTLAASFACNGFRFLTDDGLILEPDRNGLQVIPSHPSLRLWNDSEKALIPSGTKTTPGLSFTSKSRFLAGPDIAYCNHTLALHRVYFLGDDESKDIAITPITGAESMMEWVKHSFLLDVEKRSLLASHFKQVAKLANHQIHFRLDYPRRFEELANIRHAIVDHIYEEDAS